MALSQPSSAVSLGSSSIVVPSLIAAARKENIRAQAFIVEHPCRSVFYSRSLGRRSVTSPSTRECNAGICPLAGRCSELVGAEGGITCDQAWESHVRQSQGQSTNPFRPFASLSWACCRFGNGAGSYTRLGACRLSRRSVWMISPFGELGLFLGSFLGIGWPELAEQGSARAFVGFSHEYFQSYFVRQTRAAMSGRLEQ